MPTRFSGWCVALGLMLSSQLMPQGSDLVPWRDMLLPAIAWIVLGEAGYWAMRLVAPAPLPRLRCWTGGVVLVAAATLLLLPVAELHRDPGLFVVALASLALATVWLLFDLLTLALWRLSRSALPPSFTLGRLLVWLMVFLALAMEVLELGFGADDDALFPLALTLMLLPFGVILATVFFDYPAALDRRRRNQDNAFQELVAHAPPPPVARVMPGSQRR